MKGLNQLLFWLLLLITLSCLVIIHGIQWEVIVANEINLFVGETIMYLAGLGALYFGWRTINHKIPSKNKPD